MNLLAKLGLMRVSEHEAVKRSAEADRQALRRMTVSRDDWQKLATDLGIIVEATKDDAARWRAARDRRANNRKGKA